MIIFSPAIIICYDKIQFKRKVNMVFWIILFIAILTGTIMPLQTGINASLAKYLHHPFHAAFISFVGGLLSVTLICIVSGKMFPTQKEILSAPPHLWIGGCLGTIFVIVSIILAPKLGATVYVSSIIAGQLFGSIILDHYGLLGFSVHPVNYLRILGILLLTSGVVLVKIF